MDEDRLEPLQQELELISAAFSPSEVVVVSQHLTTNKDGGVDTITAQIKVICSSSTTVLFWISTLNYPDEAIKTSINSTELPRTAVDDFGQQLNQFVEAHVGNSYCFDAIQFVMEMYRTVKETTAVAAAITGTSGKNSNVTKEEPKRQLMQVLIWFHHIKSGMKKKEIRDCADDLRVGGFWKEGFPGIIIAEGAADDISEYIKCLQKLRWQHMVVRGERVVTIDNESVSCDEYRKMPLPIQEVEDTSEMGRRCTSCGLHDLFMTLHKGYASTAGTIEP